jgi:hypothetical protein
MFFFEDMYIYTTEQNEKALSTRHNLFPSYDKVLIDMMYR